MKKIDKIILYIVFCLPAVLLVVYFLVCITTGKTTEEVVREDDLSESFNGKVETLNYERQNHNIKVAILSNGYRYEIFRNWENQINIGDSLSKKKNSLEVEVYRQGQPKLVLDYRDIYKKEK